MEFEDKVVLITGSSSGIGAETAIHFARQSAKLALVGRNEKNLKKVALSCEKEKGIKPLEIIADIANEADVEEIIKVTIDHFAKLDVLVNNAGIPASGGVKDTTLDTFDKVMSVNVRGAFHLTSLAVPYLIQSKGSIVNVSSIVSFKGNPGMTVYCMSKAALDQFTRCTAVELGPNGVRVNSVNPGLIKTDILIKTSSTERVVSGFIEKVIEDTPLGKLGETSDVAALILFLASDKAKHISGCCYAVDGGNLLV